MRRPNRHILSYDLSLSELLNKALTGTSSYARQLMILSFTSLSIILQLLLHLLRRLPQI